MVVDFSHHLWGAVVQFLASSPSYGSVSEKFLQRWDKPSKLEIVACPKGFDAEFAASIAFKIGQLFLRDPQSGDQIRPQAIAAALVDIIEQKESSAYQLEVGGDGYINFSMTDVGRSRFLESVIARPELLFSTNAASESGRLELVELDQGSLIEWDNPLLRTKQAPHVDEELRGFVDTFSKQEPSFDDFLMILICLSDSNHDLRPYLQDLKGSQNIPWYLNRFFSDVRVLSRMSEEFGDNSSREKSSNSSYLMACLSDSVNLICSFRFILSQSILSVRPEILLSYLLQIIKSFYRFYNSPQLRSRLVEDQGEISNFCQIAFLFEEIVSGSLKHLREFHRATILAQK